MPSPTPTCHSGTPTRHSPTPTRHSGMFSAGIQNTCPDTGLRRHDGCRSGIPIMEPWPGRISLRPRHNSKAAHGPATFISNAGHLPIHTLCGISLSFPFIFAFQFDIFLFSARFFRLFLAALTKDSPSPGPFRPIPFRTSRFEPPGSAPPGHLTPEDLSPDLVDGFFAQPRPLSEKWYPLLFILRCGRMPITALSWA